MTAYCFCATVSSAFAKQRVRCSHTEVKRERAPVSFASAVEAWNSYMTSNKFQFLCSANGPLFKFPGRRAWHLIPCEGLLCLVRNLLFGFCPKLRSVHIESVVVYSRAPRDFTIWLSRSRPVDGNRLRELLISSSHRDRQAKGKTRGLMGRIPIEESQAAIWRLVTVDLHAFQHCLRK